MPYADCETHGGQGGVEVCAHIDAAIQRGTRCELHELADCLLCEACVAHFGFASRPRVPAHRGWMVVPVKFDEFSGYDEFNATSACVCTQCLAEWELKSWRAAGLEDPFHAYEHTLTNQMEADELRRALLSAFSFRKTRLCSEALEHTLSVDPGCIASPTTITIQFVEDAASQDAVLAWLDEALGARETPQRHVWFFRTFEVRRSASGACAQANSDLLRVEETDPPPPGRSKHRLWQGPPTSIDELGLPRMTSD